MTDLTNNIVSFTQSKIYQTGFIYKVTAWLSNTLVFRYFDIDISYGINFNFSFISALKFRHKFK